jgi:hypothetical protein
MNISEQIKKREENLKCGGKKKPIPTHATGKKVFPLKKGMPDMKKGMPNMKKEC